MDWFTSWKQEIDHYILIYTNFGHKNTSWHKNFTPPKPYAMKGCALKRNLKRTQSQKLSPHNVLQQLSFSNCVRLPMILLYVHDVSLAFWYVLGLHRGLIFEVRRLRELMCNNKLFCLCIFYWRMFGNNLYKAWNNCPYLLGHVAQWVSASLCSQLTTDTTQSHICLNFGP